jgi:hypothetical protein
MNPTAAVTTRLIPSESYFPENRRRPSTISSKGKRMSESTTAKRLFAVRIHPESGPPSFVISLASSPDQAEELARGKVGHADAPTTVNECPEGEAIFISFGEVTFK